MVDPRQEMANEPAGSRADTPILPAHIEATVQAIAALHAEHRKGATPTERVIERLGAIVARPRFTASAAAAMLIWMWANMAAPRFGFAPLDAPPFPWMDTAVSISAFFMTTVILGSQRRDDQLSNLREQLTLELAILSEQKTAKTIQLLEELRRDSPTLPDRVDPEAEEMSKPADPQAVLSALVDTDAEASLVNGDASEGNLGGVSRPSPVGG